MTKLACSILRPLLLILLSCSVGLWTSVRATATGGTTTLTVGVGGAIIFREDGRTCEADAGEAYVVNTQTGGAAACNATKVEDDIAKRIAQIVRFCSDDAVEFGRITTSCEDAIQAASRGLGVESLGLYVAAVVNNNDDHLDLAVEVVKEIAVKAVEESSDPVAAEIVVASTVEEVPLNPSYTAPILDALPELPSEPEASTVEGDEEGQQEEAAPEEETPPPPAPDNTEADNTPLPTAAPPPPRASPPPCCASCDAPDLGPAGCVCCD